MNNKIRACFLIVFIAVLSSCNKEERFMAEPVKAKPEKVFYGQTGGKNVPPILSITMQDAEMVNVESAIANAVSISYVDSNLAARIFSDVQSQGYKLWGRYMREGQFAYANNIRRYIERKYALVTGKLFVYGDLTARSPLYNCCVSWKYDVAVVLRGDNGKLYVIDPRLFTTVVNADVWSDSHTFPTECNPSPTASPRRAVVAGESFAPMNEDNTQYLKDDPNYTLTNRWVGRYSDSVGCNCILL